MESKFNNDASQCLFIGERNLEEVIAQDEKELLDVNGSFGAIADRLDFILETGKSARSFPFNVDDKVTITFYGITKGCQECPYEVCQNEKYSNWSEVVCIKSKKTEKILTINSGTSHLARSHHLLEKDNAYGISAKEFYESFM